MPSVSNFSVFVVCVLLSKYGTWGHVMSRLTTGIYMQIGLNALHLAAKDGHLEIVADLLKRGAAVDAATKKGNTALHIASLGKFILLHFVLNIVTELYMCLDLIQQTLTKCNITYFRTCLACLTVP